MPKAKHPNSARRAGRTSSARKEDTFARPPSRALVKALEAVEKMSGKRK